MFGNVGAAYRLPALFINNRPTAGTFSEYLWRGRSCASIGSALLNIGVVRAFILQSANFKIDKKLDSPDFTGPNGYIQVSSPFRAVKGKVGVHSGEYPGLILFLQIV